MNSTDKVGKEDLTILEQIYNSLETNKTAVLPTELTNKLFRLTEDFKKGVEEALKHDVKTREYFKNQILPNYENWLERLPQKPKYK